jgi:hypothetical protein
MVGVDGLLRAWSNKPGSFSHIRFI